MVESYLFATIDEEFVNALIKTCKSIDYTIQCMSTIIRNISFLLGEVQT